MKWTTEAENELSRVPFFVRRHVRKRVEAEAAQFRASEVTPGHIDSCRKKFLGAMEQEVRGYQVEICFGTGSCPNRAVADGELAKELEEMLEGKAIRSLLEKRVRGPLKLHHEFRVSVSDCPNACSRPQIVDVGLIGAQRPGVTDEPCTRCLACVETCKEDAIELSDDGKPPRIDPDKCVWCGQCISVCPSRTLEKNASGYRLLIGGKLGRRPQLAQEIAGIYSKGEVLAAVEKCVDHYLEMNVRGERFGEILRRTGSEFLPEVSRDKTEQ
ncbi:MAG: 4Fe-4S binding protein [Deltaproteobacteria bacterium]|jgi:anaerobic sulfite reductase subunit C